MFERLHAWFRENRNGVLLGSAMVLAMLALISMTECTRG